MADLTDAMYRQDKFAGHYGVLSAKASRAADNAKLRRQTIEAKVYKEVRDKAATEKLKLTEAQIKAEIDTDTRVVKAKMEQNEAEYYENLGKSCVEAFRQRRDMLTQISKHELEERKGEMSLNNLEAAKEKAMEVLNKSAA